MGISNGVGTFSGMICPFVTENLKSSQVWGRSYICCVHVHAQGDKGWQKVFLLAAMIHFTGVIFYGIFASGEQQDWAEPPDEEEPTMLSVSGHNLAKDGACARCAPGRLWACAVHAGYGSTKDVHIAPLPDTQQLMAKMHTAPQSVRNEEWR
jgi:hypothetical protein